MFEEYPKDTIARPLCKRISRGFDLESGYIKLDTLIRYMKVVLLAGGFGSRNLRNLSSNQNR